jgi:hypothetical protein
MGVVVTRKMMTPTWVLCGELWLQPEARPSTLLSSFLSAYQWVTAATAKNIDIYRLKRREIIPVTVPVLL